MGMIHSGHRTSELWGLEQVEQTIRNFAPDVVCTEIAPDRWQRIERDLRERDAIVDPRVLRFPEYTDVILRLSVSLGFTIVRSPPGTTSPLRICGATLRHEAYRGA